MIVALSSSAGDFIYSILNHRYSRCGYGEQEVAMKIEGRNEESRWKARTRHEEGAAAMGAKCDGDKHMFEYCAYQE